MPTTPIKLQYSNTYNSLLVIDSLCNTYLYDKRESKLKSLKLMKPATMVEPSIFETNNHSLFMMDVDNQAVLFDIRMAADFTLRKFEETFNAGCFYDSRYLVLGGESLYFVDQGDLSLKERLFEGKGSIRTIGCNESLLVAGGFDCCLQVS